VVSGVQVNSPFLPVVVRVLTVPRLPEGPYLSTMVTGAAVSSVSHLSVTGVPAFTELGNEVKLMAAEAMDAKAAPATRRVLMKRMVAVEVVL